eukprot:2857183-Pyramimonas_sp.AAC.1
MYHPSSVPKRSTLPPTFHITGGVEPAELGPDCAGARGQRPLLLPAVHPRRDLRPRDEVPHQGAVPSHRGIH